MNRSTLGAFAIAGASLFMISGCADTSRSRNLGDPNVSGTTLAQQVCSNCHGVTGNSVSPNFPRLAGQQKDYIVAQLQDFKSHNRQDPPGFEYMWGLSRSLTTKQMEELAAYFAAQTPTPNATGNDAAKAAAGEQIFTGGVPATGVPACASCHGAQGLGNGAFPRLAGQHADYVVKQLIVFQRTNQRPGGKVMKPVAHELTPGDIDNVAAFVQTLPRS